MIKANNPALSSWLEVPENSDFPIQNIPFGIVKRSGGEVVAATIIGDTVIDLYQLSKLGYLEGTGVDSEVFNSEVLNDFIELGKSVTRKVRDKISEVFEAGNDKLRDNDTDKEKVLLNAGDVTNLMPVFVRDYTDFYSSIEHATNVGIMFRGKENALMPNWKHIPVGYHGRASSIVVSGTPLHRPKGQLKPSDEEPPVYGASRLLDFELEVAFIAGKATKLGDSVSTSEAENHIFGLVLFNDWSARDIQKWEYVPLGPFLGKNFGSCASPWIVTLDALDPFRVPGYEQNPEVLPYLKYEGDKTYDVNLQVIIKTPDGTENTVSRSNFRYMYWNMAQQLAHQTVNGCNINVGDMYASGTISGPTEDSYGSMLELSWRGTKPLKMADGTERKFIQDGDVLIMRGYAEKNGVRVGFGEVNTEVLPAK